MIDRYVLAETLDVRAAGRLLDEMLERRGRPLHVDGSQVARLGGQCLQVLLAARAAWTKDGRTLELRDPSTALKEALALMGAGALLDPAAAPLETAP